MRHILTTLTAATVLALALTAQANAGHHMQHNDHQQNQNCYTTGASLSSTVCHNKSSLHACFDHECRFLKSDCCDFRYRCWCPSCDTYIFWYPSDDCWYYWCASQDRYLPYDQITNYPPDANVIPQVPGGLPPVVPGGNDNGPTTGQDQPQDQPPVPPADIKDNGPTTVQDQPLMPPADIRDNGPTTVKGGPPSTPNNPFAK